MRSAASTPAPSQRVSIPGLDPAAPYSSRLSARSALYSELRLLLDGLDRALPPAAYRSLVLDENRLVRPSSSARQKLWRELHARYLLDASEPLFFAFWSEWQRCESEPERGLTAYLLFALNDRLVTDLGTTWLFSLLRRAPAELRPVEVGAFIARSAARHPEVAGWSAETTLAVAQKYCASIRDFGLARGTVRKQTIRPALYGAPFRLLVRALRLVRTPLLVMVQHPVFRLLAIEGREVVSALGELNRQGALRFRMQGDVVELELEAAA